MDWFKEINAAVTICDNEGIVVYMNDRSGEVFMNDGGKGLIGTSLFSCHTEAALQKLQALMKSGSTNVYTIEKNGKKKLIYQTPWLVDNAVSGLIEISIELPDIMEHFIRQQS